MTIVHANNDNFTTNGHAMIPMFFINGVSLGAIVVWITIQLYGWSLRKQNKIHRRNLLRGLGHKEDDDKTVLGFFHPYCNAGGGGERVLWTAIAHVQRTRPNVVSVVYSGDTDATKQEILAKVQSRFNIELDHSSLEFVFLHSRRWVEDSAWPRLTLLGQSIGSMWLAWEAMSKLIPDLYIDTMGYAFSFHIASLLGRAPIGAYVHYPTISTDMVKRVQSRTRWHTNTDSISSSAFLSQAKLLYYRVFMYYYAVSLRTASFLMVNSTWTKEHIDAILQYSNPILDILNLLPPLVLLKLFTSDSAPKSATIVYPPCDTKELSLFGLEKRERVILSLAQFRPEKDHSAQIHAFHQLLEKHPEYKTDKHLGVRLLLIGGSRNEGDAGRVAQLRGLVGELGIEDHVEFIVNAPYATVLDWLSRASVGLSTMVDEHFGINIVEYMAAGVIPVTHASGGPLKDIVVPLGGEITGMWVFQHLLGIDSGTSPFEIGYHAKTPTEFSEAFHRVLSLSADEEPSNAA
ncbi:mannosyltransferase [Ephemerocybe angulata]|uniref:GDP-Man:Man(3)GlcNAc(2)-PP-Dol alpha-1,2-mannosyltransferase n=1 Tax=Ephemerocybe angulata TaxID=980116 RepID=A0A8H6HZI9_9AGAR|nr:mannosyltransferase [Tulosesus angulatus]